MAYDATKPANNSNPVAADIRENFRALLEDGIIELSGAPGTPAISGITATPTEINTVADGSTAKNDHTHDSGDLESNSVTQTQIANSAVGQGELKTATSAQQVTVNASSGNTICLTGGTYSMVTWGAENQEMIGFGGSNTAAGVIGFYNSNANPRVVWVDSRYFQASPPYDLGDGEILLFVYLVVDKNGTPQGISVAPDPIWAHHGPTNIIPQYIKKNGKPYRQYKELMGMPFNEAINDPKIFYRYMKGEIKTKIVEKEINHSIKNRDMDIVPHPYYLNDLKGKTAIILDPVSPIMERLAEIEKEVGAKEISKIIEQGYLKFSNNKLNRKAPKALMPVAFNWK